MQQAKSSSPLGGSRILRDRIVSEDVFSRGCVMLTPSSASDVSQLGMVMV